MTKDVFRWDPLCAIESPVSNSRFSCIINCINCISRSTNHRAPVLYRLAEIASSKVDICNIAHRD